MRPFRWPRRRVRAIVGGGRLRRESERERGDARSEHCVQIDVARRASRRRAMFWIDDNIWCLLVFEVETMM
jgi:hypothetical protein